MPSRVEEYHGLALQAPVHRAGRCLAFGARTMELTQVLCRV